MPDVRTEHVESGQTIDMPLIAGRNPFGRGPWEVDACFPRRFVGTVDMATVDEGYADFLYGLVRALRPRVVLETGTHRGRSAKAIALALEQNQQGRLYTVDMDDYRLMTSGAIPQDVAERVVQVVGRTPEVYEEEPLRGVEGIDFAHIDGDHTREGLLADLAFVRERMDDECWVVVDNARDEGWPAVREVLDEIGEPSVQLATMCGADLIWLCRTRGQSLKE